MHRTSAGAAVGRAHNDHAWKRGRPIRGLPLDRPNARNVLPPADRLCSGRVVTKHRSESAGKLGPTPASQVPREAGQIEPEPPQIPLPLVLRTGQLVWGDDVDGTIAEALRRANDDPENRTATGDAAACLDDYLTVHGPKVASADIKRDATAAGHNVEALKRARRKLQIAVVNEGFPRITFWLRQSGQAARGDTLTDPTNPTGHNGHRSGQSGQSEHTGSW